MIYQHSFSLVRADKAPLLTAIANQPTGEFVTVLDNNGNEIQVERIHGGYAYIGSLGMWIMVLASGTDSGFEQMRTLAGDGVIELARLTEGWPELDEAADATEANAWLGMQGLPEIQPATKRELVDRIGGFFLNGFGVGSVYVA